MSGRRVLAHDLVEKRRQVVGHKRFLAGHHFIGDDGERKLVRSPVHGLPLHLLRRHVTGGAHHRPGLGHLLRNDFRHAEIGDFRLAVVMHHDIGRLDVPMHDALAVGVIERERRLPQDVQHLCRFQCIGRGEQLFEGRPVDEFHEDIRHAVFLGDVVNRNDVGMGEDARRLRLAEEAVAQPLPFRAVR